MATAERRALAATLLLDLPRDQTPGINQGAELEKVVVATVRYFL